MPIMSFEMRMRRRKILKEVSYFVVYVLLSATAAVALGAAITLGTVGYVFIRGIVG